MINFSWKKTAVIKFEIVTNIKFDMPEVDLLIGVQDSIVIWFQGKYRNRLTTSGGH